jgi:uncharacterized protein YggU (UPF0235/DUF167 family)
MTAPGRLPVRQSATGIELRIRLTPRAARDAVDGVVTGADDAVHLAARVRAVPEKGKANEALERLVAQWIGVPRSSVAVAGGTTSRLKTVAVEGDAAELAERVAALVAEA